MAKKKWNINQTKKYLKVESEQWTAKINVTPEMARELLDRTNRRNRKINQSHMLMMRRDMECGRWKNDIDHIGFSQETGLLVNGQHRLEALAGAEIDYVTLKFDFDVEQHISMDTGYNRTYADQIRLSRRNGYDGMPNKFKPIVCAGVKLSYPSLSLSNSELEVLWKEYGDKLEEAEKAGLFNVGSRAGLTVKSSLFWAYLSGVDLEFLSHFAETLRDGITTKRNDIPIIRLRDALVDLRGSGKGLDVKRAQYTQQCILDVLNGSESNRLPSKPLMHYQESANFLSVLNK